MTIEEKAKAYDSMFERLKEMYNNNKTNVAARLKYERYFPELKESGDEKIRKAIIEFFESEDDNTTYSLVPKKDIIAWLEKQGEQKGTLCDTCRKAQPSHSCQDITELGRCALEKQSEQKPIYHKFRIGDKVKKGYLTYTVEDIDEDSYKLQAYSKDGNKGCTVFLAIGYEKDYELVEQKPVECSEDNLPEFESYLCLMFQKFRIKYSTEGVCTNGEIIDFVEEHAQKLKDTLCHAWSEEDERDFDVIYGIIYNSCNAEDASRLIEWLKSLKDRVQPKQYWSKEDEKMIENIIDTINMSIEDCDVDDVGTKAKQPETINSKWFKEHVYPQKQWKPSDNELEALRLAAEKDGTCLMGLYEQLKKLKG